MFMIRYGSYRIGEWRPRSLNGKSKLKSAEAKMAGNWLKTFSPIRGRRQPSFVAGLIAGRVLSSMLLFLLMFMLLQVGAVSRAASSKPPLRLYLDVDMTGARASGVAIERGIRTALAQSGYRMGGRPVELVVLDHRGNSARSLANLKVFQADPHGLALFGGQHSSPLLAHQHFINDNQLLTLVPWATAVAITRPFDGNNWIFRLSVDDRIAGEVFVRRAVEERGFRHPGLLLEESEWGKSFYQQIVDSLNGRKLSPVTTSYLEWGGSVEATKILLRSMKETGADVVLMDASAREGLTVLKAMASLPPEKRLPIISHWQLTSVDLPEAMPQEERERVDLEFIQTRFSFLDVEPQSRAELVLQQAIELFSDIQLPRDIMAPSGFANAYDMTRILQAAVQQSDLTGNVHRDRQLVHDALENLDGPVFGLIKTYEKPFSPYAPGALDAHEALSSDDYTFGRFNEHDAITLIR